MAQTMHSPDGHEPSPWTFGMPDRLDKALKVSGVSNGEMAEALDVSRNTITNYTSGRTTPSKLQVKEWAIRTGAPFDWLWDGVDPTEKAPTRRGGGQWLPELDSNQQPIGSRPATLAPIIALAEHRQRKSHKRSAS